ncbi:chromatin modification-related protein EAF1-like [Schistocerca americana]|uniref:chromatin modification-related protein EAF1-like n=1 Tax=Schistocerca americana TaxID=7009 RepID=UPI001F4FD7E0|nr:chromatin modification-related protein EAF1-like [Schistocerca americana]
MVRRLAERRPPSCRRRLSSGSGASNGAVTPAADAQPSRQLFSSASSRGYSMPARPLTRRKRAATRTAPQQRGFSREQTPASNASTGSGSQSPGRLSVQCLELSATQQRVRAGAACLLEPRVVLSAARASRNRGSRQAAQAQNSPQVHTRRVANGEEGGKALDAIDIAINVCHLSPKCRGGQGARREQQQRQQQQQQRQRGGLQLVPAQPLALQCTRLQLAPRSRPPSQQRPTPRRP